jgi:hypothetical protein
VRAAGVAGAAAALLVAGSARAADPQISVGIGADSAEVGEPFTIELKALVEQGTAPPRDPQMPPPAGLTVVEGPSISTQMMMNSFGARATVRTGIGATWALTGSKPGRYTIPSPTVVVGGKRYGGGPLSIQITPATGRPRQRQGSSPFLMPGGPGFGFNWPFQNDTQTEDTLPTAPELTLPAARDEVAFLHATADKLNVVVGEQVTISFYTYVRYEAALRNDPHPTARFEAPLADFLRVPLIKNPGTDRPSSATAGGQRYVTRLFDRVAVFPLHAGDLHTGSMRLTFGGSRGVSFGDRSSEDLVIRVTEPPRTGRPPGYALGDVGQQLALTASVQPRRLEQGGSLAVTLRVEGKGNVPQVVRLPERVGVEWLDPEKKEGLDAPNGVVGGWRTLGYVVRIKESGTVDLGEVTLPYWDPGARTYQVARARLGTVEVTPVAPTIDPVTKVQTNVGDGPKVDAFATFPPARSTLGAYTPPRARLLDGGALWFLMAAPPLLVGVMGAGSSAVRRARARRASAKDTPAALAAQALRDAAAAEAGGDAKALCAALERAVHLAIEGATGLKSRGVMVAELAAELERRGVSRALGDEAAGALADAEAIRFDPVPDTARTRELATRVRALVAALGRHGGA